MNYYVYILKCADNSYYTGVTNNIERRIAEHQNGNDIRCYTFNRRPLELVYSESFPEIDYAIRREKQIKGWNRKKKEALISGSYYKLPKLAAGDASTSQDDDAASPLLILSI